MIKGFFSPIQREFLFCVSFLLRWWCLQVVVVVLALRQGSSESERKVEKIKNRQF